nr:MAG TPA: zinc-ribbon domain protein [Caudoviricetes sp.]
MAEYIERGVFLKDIEERNCLPCRRAIQDRGGSLCEICWINDLRNEIINAPAADVVPVAHGWWNADETCSLCGEKSTEGLDATKWDYWFPNYCPNCGAKMDLEALQ